VKVTRIAYSTGLNGGKYLQLADQARRLGAVHSKVWREYGSMRGVGVRDREIRDQWMSDGTAAAFGLPANAWKETLRDAVGDIVALREAAKLHVRKAIHLHTGDSVERRRLYGALKRDAWTTDPYLRRMMRRHWKHLRSRASNQIVVRADDYRTFQLADGGNVWLSIPGLERRKTGKIPLNTTVAPRGTLRVLLRSGRVEVHWQVDAASMKTSQRPQGSRKLGVDKGYSEVLVDSDGERHGPRLGELLSRESDHSKVKNARRARIRAVADKARERGDLAKAERIVRSNLGTVKRDRRRLRFRQHVRTETITAVHALVDKAGHIVAEDLTRTFVSRVRLGRDVNRRLAAWTKGVTAEAITNVSERRGSALTLVNAAYTSQVAPCCGVLGRRSGDRLDCTGCRAVWQADHAAAINVLRRDADPDIGLWTPHTRVKQILQKRSRHRTRLPVLDPSTTVRGANHPIRAIRPRN
jgi:IS605 OrfB family transposase